MNKKELIDKMKKLQDDGDYEESHYEADNLLCEFLKHLGYSELVDEYHKVGKWYA